MLNDWTLWNGEKLEGNFVLLVESHLGKAIVRAIITNAYCSDGCWCFHEGLSSTEQYLNIYEVGRNRDVQLYDPKRGDRVFYAKQPTLPNGKEFLLATVVSRSYRGLAVVDEELIDDLG